MLILRSWAHHTSNWRQILYLGFYTNSKYHYQKLSWSVHSVRYLPYKSNRYTDVLGTWHVRVPYQANTVNGWWLQCDFWSNNPSWASNGEMAHYHATIASFLLHGILAEFVECAIPNANIKHLVNCLRSGNEFFMNNTLGIVKTNQHWLNF